MKAIISIISLYCKDSDISKITKDKDPFLTTRKDKVNSFNQYFWFVGPNMQSNINFVHKSFNYFLKNSCNEFIFIKPCTKKEIINTIFDFSSNNAAGPNSIPIRIIKLVEDCVANNLSVIFNIFFISGGFLNKLKIANILPVFLKRAKVNAKVTDQFR